MAKKVINTEQLRSILAAVVSNLYSLEDGEDLASRLEALESEAYVTVTISEEEPTLENTLWLKPVSDFEGAVTYTLSSITVSDDEPDADNTLWFQPA